MVGPALSRLLTLRHRAEQARAMEKPPLGGGPSRGRGGCVQLGISPQPGLKLRFCNPRALPVENNAEMVQLWL